MLRRPRPAGTHGCSPIGGRHCVLAADGTVIGPVRRRRRRPQVPPPPPPRAGRCGRRGHAARGSAPPDLRRGP
eukprot:1191151-Prorocentrum_minimum.AAC.1